MRTPVIDADHDLPPAHPRRRATDANVSAHHEAHEIAERILETSPDCIKLLDCDARLLSMNAGGMARLEICDFGPLVHASWIDFWEGDDRRAARYAVQMALEGRIGRFTGYFPTTVTRRPMWWDVVVSPIRSNDGSVSRILAVSRDVTTETLTNEMMRAVTEGTALVGGAEFFPALVRHLARALRVPCAMVTQCTSPHKDRVRTLAYWRGDAIAANIEYALAGTPCQAVIEGRASHHPANLQVLFPADSTLTALGAQSYIGLPIAGASGEVLGHVAVLDVKPMPDDEVSRALLRTFAARAGVEMERVLATERIATLNRQLAAAAERAQSLLTINNAVVLNLTEDALFRAITTALKPVLPFDGCAIVLSDARHATMRIAAVELAMRSDVIVPGRQVVAEDTLTGRALAGRAPVLRRDLSVDRELPGEERLYAEGIRSCVVAPLLVRSRPLGTLSVVSLRAGQYSDADAGLLQEVANQVALALENMREYEEIGRLKAQVERENVYLREEIRGEHPVDEVLRGSPALSSVIGTVERVAPTDTTVLILGETGTGKELVARALHQRSGRRDRPLVKVNCGAIAAGLIESELFGHVKGAFTGALERRTGRFELADRGTLFLDEIGELPLEMQVKLLRVLQEQEFEPVGSSRTIKVDVRVIAATNRDLEAEVAAGRFRADLYYRLNVVPIRVPPLRERPGDIPALAAFFLGRLSRRVGRPTRHISRESLDRLLAYGWPGNVRELENVVERAIILSSGESDSLDIGADLVPASTRPCEPSLPAGAEGCRPDRLEDVERTHIASVLERTGWVIDGPRGAARVLNMHPNTLRSRLKKLGIGRSLPKTTPRD